MSIIEDDVVEKTVREAMILITPSTSSGSVKDEGDDWSTITMRECGYNMKFASLHNPENSVRTHIISKPFDNRKYLQYSFVHRLFGIHTKEKSPHVMDDPR